VPSERSDLNGFKGPAPLHRSLRSRSPAPDGARPLDALAYAAGRSARSAKLQASRTKNPDRMSTSHNWRTEKGSGPALCSQDRRTLNDGTDHVA
jgi:hypothetical protein